MRRALADKGWYDLFPEIKETPLNQNPDEIPASEPEPDPPGRISYLLPDGYKNITDLWFPEQGPDGGAEAPSSTQLCAVENVFELPKPKWASWVDVHKSAILPAKITVRDLAEFLGLKSWQLNRDLIEMNLFCKADTFLDFAVAAALCAKRGITAWQAKD